LDVGSALKLKRNLLSIYLTIVIDLVFVNNQHRIVDSGVVSLSLSDHSLVYCVVKSGVKKAPPRTIEYLSYKSFNTNTFIQDMNNVPWHVVEN
jgi:hypothetical protein